MADLTTVSEVKAYAGVTGQGDDARIESIVSAVSAAISGYIGNSFDAQPIVGERTDHPLGAVLLERPAASIDAVRVNGATLSASGYRLQGDRVLWREADSYGGATSWGGVVEVDYTPTSSVPDDLEFAAREIAAFMVKQSGLSVGSGRLGLSAQANADTGSADYFTQSLRQLPASRMILGRYRRVA